MAKRGLSGRKRVGLELSEMIRQLNVLAPESCSEDWDNVGLLVGDPHWQTDSAVVSVDLTPESVAAAKKVGARLIVNHHPCIFPKSRGLSRVTPTTLVWEAIQAGIAVYSCHTNFDRCALEVPEQICRGLKVRALGRLHDHPEAALKKLVVFVPETHVDQVHQALSAAGAGHVGNYDSCAFLAAGEGRFRGNDSTRPFLGKPGRLEKAKERRLETVFPAGLESVILRALKSSHPYEEIAHDVYSVEQRVSSIGLTSGLGYGFYGDLEKPANLREFAGQVESLFEASGAIVTPAVKGAPSRNFPKVTRMAFGAGKGSSFISAALQAGVDVFVTGEVGYHDALSASRRGMSVIELGHRESERFYLKTMTGWLENMGLKVIELNIPTQTIASWGE